VARALIIGCGCRGRELGSDLLAAGWQVRGTTRTQRGVRAIENAGIEAVIADPDRVATVLERIEGVTVIFWLLGSARGRAAALAAIHGPRLERLLEEIVDTHVRGLVYEAAGDVDAGLLARGAEIVAEAGRRWRIRFAVVDAEPADPGAWRAAMLAASKRLIGT
jgi:nucleoside-diphosphate-sugar epimerase